MMFTPLALAAPANERAERYREITEVIQSILDDETDWVAAMATVACELSHAFAYFDWTGFYRVTSPELLVIGPYQGAHGCLRIAFDRGVCGAAARERKTQLVADVERFPGHIACSSATRSEIVVPVIGGSGRLLGVLDVDCNTENAFTEVDQQGLEALCQWLGATFDPV